jgi:hypothetical protein
MAELTATSLRFASLTQAVDYICSQVEAGDPHALTSVMAGLHPDDSYDYVRYFENSVWPKLRSRQKEGCMRALYTGRDFPADSASFKLGGHDSELGFINIDFVRFDDGWALQRIWVCH